MSSATIKIGQTVSRYTLSRTFSRSKYIYKKKGSTYKSHTYRDCNHPIGRNDNGIAIEPFSKTKGIFEHWEKRFVIVCRRFIYFSLSDLLLTLGLHIYIAWTYIDSPYSAPLSPTYTRNRIHIKREKSIPKSCSVCRQIYIWNHLCDTQKVNPATKPTSIFINNNY